MTSGLKTLARAAVFELRRYTLGTAQASAFKRAMDSGKFSLRTTHSPVLGYWQTELGAINQVFHIWRYDSVEARAAVRKALAEDPAWTNFVKEELLPHITRMENCVCRLMEGDADVGLEDTGTYQLHEITFHGLSADDAAAQASIAAKMMANIDGVYVRALFSPLIGCQNQYWLLSSVGEHANLLMKQPDWGDLLKNAQVSNVLLQPYSWSKW